MDSVARLLLTASKRLQKDGANKPGEDVRGKGVTVEKDVGVLEKG